MSYHYTYYKLVNYLNSGQLKTVCLKFDICTPTFKNIYYIVRRNMKFNKNCRFKEFKIAMIKKIVKQFDEIKLKTNIFINTRIILLPRRIQYICINTILLMGLIRIFRLFMIDFCFCINNKENYLETIP